MKSSKPDDWIFSHRVFYVFELNSRPCPCFFSRAVQLFSQCFGVSTAPAVPRKYWRSHTAQAPFIDGDDDLVRSRYGLVSACPYESNCESSRYFITRKEAACGSRRCCSSPQRLGEDAVREVFRPLKSSGMKQRSILIGMGWDCSELMVCQMELVSHLLTSASWEFRKITFYPLQPSYSL